MRGNFPEFRDRLLAWFGDRKRDLPWRANPSLYKTVVSEFMLQQTQVDTVLPYFRRWMQRFPDFAALAGAGETAVLKEWEGLGYYSRARNLHKLAKSILAEGTPQDAAGWLARPGVGPYTAAAISSIAQGQPEPVIDGNVIRVLARLQQDPAPIRSSAEARKRFLPLARKLIDPARPGDYNEALMELGATVCRKARPQCPLCPVRAHCTAAAKGNPEALPVILRKAATRREVARLWLAEDNRILLHFHPGSARRLAGMAELPEIPHPEEAEPVLSRARGISSERIRESVFKLPASHPYALECRSQAQCRWVPLRDLADIPLSGPHRRWVEALLKA
jgi:A/G-specific adenine glycosylase